MPRPAPRAGPAGGAGSLLAQRVPDSADRLDQPRLAALLRLAAQVTDVDLERVRTGPEVVAPNRLEELGAGEHQPRVTQQVLEQRELCLGQLDRPLPARYLPGGGVKPQVGIAQRLSGIPVSSPQQGSQAREQLLERE